MSKHTPGPWAYAPDISRVYSVSTNELVASVAITGNTACETAWPADARLIAAAPELLEALKAFNVTEQDIVGGTATSLVVHIPIATLQAAAAAIAKAEGRS